MIALLSCLNINNNEKSFCFRNTTGGICLQSNETTRRSSVDLRGSIGNREKFTTFPTDFSKKQADEEVEAILISS